MRRRPRLCIVTSTRPVQRSSRGFFGSIRTDSIISSFAMSVTNGRAPLHPRPSAERRAPRSGSKSSEVGEYLEKLYDRHQPRNSPWRVRGLGPVDWKKLIRLETERGGDLHDDAGPRLDLALLD